MAENGAPTKPLMNGNLALSIKPRAEAETPDSTWSGSTKIGSAEIRRSESTQRERTEPLPVHIAQLEDTAAHRRPNKLLPTASRSTRTLDLNKDLPAEPSSLGQPSAPPDPPSLDRTDTEDHQLFLYILMQEFSLSEEQVRDRCARYWEASARLDLIRDRPFLPSLLDPNADPDPHGNLAIMEGRTARLRSEAALFDPAAWKRELRDQMLEPQSALSATSAATPRIALPFLDFNHYRGSVDARQLKADLELLETLRRKRKRRETGEGRRPATWFGLVRPISMREREQVPEVPQEKVTPKRSTFFKRRSRETTTDG